MYVETPSPGTEISQLFCLIRDVEWVLPDWALWLAWSHQQQQQPGHVSTCVQWAYNCSKGRRRPVNIFAQSYKKMAFSSTPEYLLVDVGYRQF